MTHNAVFLDVETLGVDFPLDALKQLPLSFAFFPHTTPAEVAARLRDATIAITNKVRLTEDLLQKARHLKLICVAATGYDVIDIAAAKKRGIAVCNVPNYSTPSVVELTLLSILSLFYHFPSYVEATRAGRWQKSTHYCFLDYPIFEMRGKTVGIVGHGNIGREVGRICRAFGMRVLFAAHLNPSRSPPDSLPLSELLPQVDLLTLHVPLRPETRHLIGAREIALMKPSAFLVNASRGGLVNEADVAEALKRGRLAGAAFDVLTTEPPAQGNPLLEKEVPNLIVTPHIAWASFESRLRLVAVLRENIAAFLEGHPKNLV